MKEQNEPQENDICDERDSIAFFVPGEPQPRVNVKQITKKTRTSAERKTAWRNHVKAVAMAYMLENQLKPFAADVPLSITMTVWRTRPKSNKNKYPVTKPDKTNFTYGIENALSGICYHDDAQNVGGKGDWLLWSDADHPPGVLIEIERVEA